MGSGSGGTNTITGDPVYNAGMLKLSQEQQAWAGEMFNMFKYGVGYNPEEVVQGYTIDGQFVQKDDPLAEKYLSAEQMIENPDYAPGGGYYQDPYGNRVTDEQMGRYGDWLKSDNPNQRRVAEKWLEGQNYTWVDQSGQEYIPNPEYMPLETTTMGKLKGYDESTTSEMEYLQNLVEANQSLLGLQTETDKANLELTQQQIGAAKELLPLQTNLTKNRIALGESFLQDASKGIDINQRKNQAQAEVQHGFKTADAAMRLNLGSYGLDPNSGKFASLNRDRALAEAAGIAGARTKAGVEAEEQAFQRKAQGLQFNL